MGPLIFIIRVGDGLIFKIVPELCFRDIKVVPLLYSDHRCLVNSYVWSMSKHFVKTLYSKMNAQHLHNADYNQLVGKILNHHSARQREIGNPSQT